MQTLYGKISFKENVNSFVFNKCNMNFTNKALNFVNVDGILHSKEIIRRPDFIKQGDIPMVIYAVTAAIRSTISFYYILDKDFNVIYVAKS